MLSWRRLRLVALAALPCALLLSIDSETHLATWYFRTLLVALLMSLAYGVTEQWPRRLRPSLARWVLQLLSVTAAVPLAALLAYLVTTGGHPDFANQPKRMIGFGMLTFMGMLFGPWLAFGAMVRQRDARVREQALAFQLERSELERQASAAQLRLLQAQVQPHFLFNTLANVRALVNTGSPRASAVLDSLIAYLRAAVPRLDGAATTLGQEVDLVRAYLELMQLRMPDRLQTAVRAQAQTLALECPPMTLLTLVENAVRHGIDPSEEGGRIEVSVELHGGRCIARVLDTGVGLREGENAGTGDSLGTGLATLRERLRLAFGGQALLRLSELRPHGLCAEVEFPARRAADADSENRP